MEVERRLSTESNMSNVVIQDINDKAIIILNRPKALNALTRTLCENLYAALKQMENGKSLLILKGSGDKAFSAGGDLFKLESAGKRRDPDYISATVQYLNACICLILKYKIPTVALWNGIVFGGGAGCAIFAKYKIVTEKTKFAMPEVKLGFHPNSASTYFFHRTKGKLGYYLALTGDALVAADVVHAGYATHFCHSSNLEKLEKELLCCSENEEISDIIEKLCEKNLPEFSLNPVIAKINRCFSAPTVEGILLGLKEDGSIWAEKTINAIDRYSPTSLKIILKQLQKGKDMELEDTLVMESNLTVNFFNHPDVFEGTRITLKDRNDIPKWHPASLSQVTDELIESYFKPYDEAKQKDLFQEIMTSRN